MGYTKTNEAVFSNELLDTVIEHSFDGIYITDGQANTLKVNRSYLTISGLKVSEVLGVNMRELVKNGTISASGTLIESPPLKRRAPRGVFHSTERKKARDRPAILRA